MTPVRVGGTIAAPRRIQDAAAIYPEAARAAGTTGVVVLEIVVDAAGAVVSASPLNGHALLINAAVDAAKQWRYEPTIFDNQAVPVVMTVTVPVR
jgi:protein TonB